MAELVIYVSKELEKFENELQESLREVVIEAGYQNVEVRIAEIRPAEGLRIRLNDFGGIDALFAKHFLDSVAFTAFIAIRGGSSIEVLYKADLIKKI